MVRICFSKKSCSASTFGTSCLPLWIGSLRSVPVFKKIRGRDMAVQGNCRISDLPELEQQERLGKDHPFQLTDIDTLVRPVDP